MNTRKIAAKILGKFDDRGDALEQSTNYLIGRMEGSIESLGNAIEALRSSQKNGVVDWDYLIEEAEIWDKGSVDLFRKHQVEYPLEKDIFDELSTRHSGRKNEHKKNCNEGTGR